MLLNISHRTTYRYDRPAHDSFNEARLRPFDNAGQRRLAYQLSSNPAPATRHSYRDLYDNHVDVLQVTEPHLELSIEANSRVETMPLPLPGPENPAGLQTPELAWQLHDYLTATPTVPLSPELWRAAVDCRPNGLTDLWADALALANWVYDAFEYIPGSTSVNATADEALAGRKGVCQDYAHVLLGLCRSLKMPARYVSGYFFNERYDPAQGSEASHAWVEVYLPSQGWRGLDPTHQRAADERYVSVAVGRDYQDIRPVSGAYRGAPERAMEVHVRITEEVTHETAT